MRLVFIALVCLSCLMTSCNSKKMDNIAVNQDRSSWILGKTFVIENEPVRANPEEGGLSFMTINEDHTASYKVGDIVEVLKWTINGNEIILSKEASERQLKFKLADDKLVDELGTKWIVK